MGVLLGSGDFEVQAQKGDYRALLDGEGRHYASVRPDLEVWNSEHLVGVIDAKYKPYWRARDEVLKPSRKLANEDLYQLFFYQQRLQRKYNLMKPPAEACGPAGGDFLTATAHKRPTHPKPIADLASISNLAFFVTI